MLGAVVRSRHGLWDGADAPMMPLRPSLPNLSGLCVMLCLACAAWSPPVARANEFDDFQQARQAYDAGDYARSESLFSSLVGGEVPRLRNRSLVIESHKYLGASYLFVGKPGAAEQQFERLLRMELDYVLDPLAFPREVQVVFEGVRARLKAEKQAAAEREAQAAADAALERQAALDAQQARLQRLRALAATERVHELNSRWIALLPFGVGQYQNDDRRLGLTLAISEGLLLGTHLTTLAIREGDRKSVV